MRLLKQTARVPPASWTDDLGWGILDAGAALTRARKHRPPRAGLAAQAPAGEHEQPTVTLRWTAADKAPAGVRASGIANFEL